MGILDDIRFAFRMMLKRKGMTSVAVVALALGIGLNATVFTLVNAVLIRGLPFDDPGEIVFPVARNLPSGEPRMRVSYTEFEDWSAMAGSFAGLSAYREDSVNLSDDRNVPERASAARVAANMFGLLRQPGLVGRDFLPDEDAPGASKVAILGHGLWQNRFGGDPAVLGRSLRIDGVGHTIVGVMPEGMEFPEGNDLWVPLVPDEELRRRENRAIGLVARLRAGVSISEAEAEISNVAAHLAREHPDSNRDVSAALLTANEYYNGGPIRLVFLALMGAVSFVLLIACANVANLLLSQAVERGREAALRTALGATRGRIVRQFLIESLVLSALGAAGGFVIALAGARLFDMAVVDVGKPYWIQFHMDLTVYAYLVGIAVVTAVAFGLAPALHTSRSDLNTHLKEGAQASIGGVRAGRMTGVLVVAELTLTIVLLAGAGLMIRSFLEMQAVDLGIGNEDVVAMRVSLPEAAYPDDARRLAFLDRLGEELRSVPGIETAALASNLPAGGAGNMVLALEGGDLRGAGDEPLEVGTVSLSPGYFEVFDAALILGRDFSAADGAPGGEVAIVNQRFASRFWPGEDPIGKRLRLGDASSSWMRIVGVSADIRHRNLAEVEPEPVVYVPLARRPPVAPYLIADGGVAAAAVSALQRAVHRVDPTLPTYDVRTVAERLRQQRWMYRVFGGLFAIFAVMALVLSATGVFGVTAYGVSQRTREIGMRMALGAAGRDVLWLVTRQGIQRLAVSLLLGLLGALALTRLIGGLLFRVDASDPVTFVAIPVILAIVTILASIVPANRAASLDPVRALRPD